METLSGFGYRARFKILTLWGLRTMFSLQDGTTSANRLELPRATLDVIGNGGI